MPLQQQLPAKDFIALEIRGVHKFIQRIKMGRTDLYRLVRFFAVLQNHKVSQPWSLCSKKPLPVGGPKIQCAPHRLFGPVVKIISKGRAHQTLEFKGQYKLPLVHHQQIPLFIGAEITGQLQIGIIKDLLFLDAVLDQQITDQCHKAVKLFSACHGSPVSPV